MPFIVTHTKLLPWIMLVTEGNEFPSRGASVNASFSGERLSDGEKKKGKKKDKKDGGILGLFR